MKTNAILVLSVFTFAMLCGQHCVGQSNVVYYGTNASSIGVSFVDTNLSASAKASIVADLQVCLNEWGKKTYLSLDLGADEPGLVGYLERPSVSPHYPEGLEFPKGVTNTSYGLALQIPKKLSDAYTNAFAFAAANSNIVVAAYEFVAFVSSTNFVSLPSNALPNYIMFKNGLPDANAESNAIVNLAPQIMPDLCEQTYHPPSILGLYYDVKGPSATNLWMRVPNSSPSAGGFVDWASTSVLWHDGKWRFCIWADWVP